MSRPLFLALLLFFPAGLFAQTDLPLSEDSQKRPGVPQGTVHGPFRWTASKIFPGTEREYWVYVPAQYDASRPACLCVAQDGLKMANGWKLLPVLDNLIHKGEIPVQIGVFIAPGVVPAPHDQSMARFNRSFEYDSLGPRYAEFLVNEILPEVKKSWNISDDPNDRLILGSSSGAICALNAAWERPDQFRRVISNVGTFVGLRGADTLSTMIRKVEPKPLRVYLADGTNDLNIYAGDWFVANQQMLSALKYSGYQVEHSFGTGGHDSKQIAAVLPEAMRFIWKGYPERIPVPVREERINVLIPGEDWVEVSSGHRFTEGPAVNEQGEVFFSDVPESKIHKIDLQGNVSVFASDVSKVNGLMFGPDGKLYACETGTQCISRFGPDGTREVVATDLPNNDIVLLADGSAYVTDSGNRKVWRISPDGQKQVVDTGLVYPNGIMTSPDQTLLTVADSKSRFTYSFQIQPDGSLAYKQRYGWLHVVDEGNSSADGMTVDTNGLLYVTTSVGLQVLDQTGRVNLILCKPQASMLSNVVFGGPNRDTLYVTCTDKVFKRKVNATGVPTSRSPVKPPQPRL